MRLKGYRTFIWNLANAIVPVMELAETTYQIPDVWMPYWIGIYIAGNLYLRYITTTPIGKPE